MAQHPFTKRDKERELTRRALIKWTLAAGAGLGVARSKVHEILEKHAGKETAQAAASLPFRRMITIMEGGGGLSNCTQAIPFPGIAAAKNPAFSWVGGTGGDMGQAFPGTAFPLWNYAGNPFGGLPAQRQVSAFMCGTNTTHSSGAQIGTYGLGGMGIAAYAASLQVTALSSIVPAIAIGTTVNGAVPFASAGNVAGAVNLFDSVASRAGGLLRGGSAADTNQADLFAAHYQILASLGQVAKNPLAKSEMTTAQGAAKFLGKNLAAALTVTNADLAEFGAVGASNGALRYAQALSFAIKAFGLGLTNNISFVGYQNDPHGFFDQGDSQTEPQVFRKILQTFMEKMAATLDPVTGQKLDENLVLAVYGDTYKSPTSRPGWGDGTPNNSSVVYVYSSGDIKAGFHGDVSAAGATTTDDAGKPVAYNGAQGLAVAMSSIAYSVAKRQSREVAGFTGATKYDVHVNPLEL
jgi:hypothetical protein